jgi:hypothetical protein
MEYDLQLLLAMIGQKEYELITLRKEMADKDAQLKSLQEKPEAPGPRAVPPIAPPVKELA